VLINIPIHAVLKFVIEGRKVFFGFARVCKRRHFLGAFETLRKATISFVTSVRPHGTARLPLEGFSYVRTVRKSSASVDRLAQQLTRVFHYGDVWFESCCRTDSPVGELSWFYSVIRVIFLKMGYVYFQIHSNSWHLTILQFYSIINGVICWGNVTTLSASRTGFSYQQQCVINLWTETYCLLRNPQNAHVHIAFCSNVMC
jgi:hypothetical protein